MRLVFILNLLFSGFFLQGQRRMGTTKRQKILLETKANRATLVSLLIQERKADLQMEVFWKFPGVQMGNKNVEWVVKKKPPIFKNSVINIPEDSPPFPSSNYEHFVISTS